MPETDIRSRLTAMVREMTGDPQAHVSEPAALPGHAGQSYSFELTTRSRADPEKLVLRLSPEGVRVAGPADVVRQARIMESLAGTAVPVPPIRWRGDDPRWFGRPYFVAGFVAGDKLALGERAFDAAEQRALARATLDMLAALHSLPWEGRRTIWGDPFSLADEMARLDTLLDRPTLEPWTTVGAPELRDRLRATLPPNPRVGCVHGDLQWSNCLYAGDRVMAVIDWELAQIGAVLIDLGWLCLFSDREMWVSADLVPEHVPTPAQLVEMYRERSGADVSDKDARWFRAFASYRFGVITAFNLMLHRRGKRPDPAWEDIALSAPRLFERGRQLIA
ncbi:MAG TPA: phosphotransferase family protein [Candidatus Binataceae bacterium]|nr:phosphotransferase family protein [Candidatus Binataceae bacterium]